MVISCLWADFGLAEKDMHPIGKKRVYKLAHRDGMQCYWCGAITHFSDGQKDDLTATVDHLIPKGLGGIDHIDNCVLSCSKCNSNRGCSFP